MDDRRGRSKKTGDRRRETGDAMHSPVLGLRSHLAGRSRGADQSLRLHRPDVDQSCLLNSQMAGTRKTAPNAAITATLVPIGCRVIS
jgi:hypothetical protein